MWTNASFFLGLPFFFFSPWYTGDKPLQPTILSLLSHFLFYIVTINNMNMAGRKRTIAIFRKPSEFQKFNWRGNQPKKNTICMDSSIMALDASTQFI